MFASRARKIVWIICIAAVLLAVAVTISYRAEVQQAYWEFVSTGEGPDYHGPNIYRTRPSDTPYDRWLENMRDEIPMFEGVVIPDISTIELHPWPEAGEGVRRLYLRFADYQITDGRIYELPAGGRSTPQSHVFETGLYFLDGPGHTLLFRDGRAPLRVDWQAESVFSVPLNARYQHFNDSERPVRFLAVTSFPFAINASGSETFVFNSLFEFTDRFDGEDDFFQRSERLQERRTATNFVPDVLTTALEPGGNRGDGRTTMSWPMAGNTVIDLHVSQMEPVTYMKAHRHSSDAFLLIVAGQGYSLVWRGGELEDRQRVDWKKNTLFVPPTYWYHQHFNPGRTASRHLAINAPTLVRNLGLRFYNQIDEDPPAIRAEWDAEVRPAGAR